MSASVKTRKGLRTQIRPQWRSITGEIVCSARHVWDNVWTSNRGIFLFRACLFHWLTSALVCIMLTRGVKCTVHLFAIDTNAYCLMLPEKISCTNCLNSLVCFGWRHLGNYWMLHMVMKNNNFHLQLYKYDSTHVTLWYHTSIIEVLGHLYLSLPFMHKICFSKWLCCSDSLISDLISTLTWQIL